MLEGGGVHSANFSQMEETAPWDMLHSSSSFCLYFF